MGLKAVRIFESLLSGAREDADMIMGNTDPYNLKEIGKKIPKSSRWELRKDQVLFDLMTFKFQQYDSLKQRLLDTGKAHLYEAVRDKHFGCGFTLRDAEEKIKKGIKCNNQTGKNLMLIRSDFLK